MTRREGVRTGLLGLWPTIVLATVLAVSLCVVSSGWADSIVVSLGVMDTTNNDPSVRVQPINLPSLAGQPSPFDGTYIGNDITGPNFSTDWQFIYTVPALESVIAATFYLQIYDADPAATNPHYPVGSFTIDGIDLTSLLNNAFNNDPVGSTNFNKTGNLNKETVVVPSSLFTSLGTGPATIHLALSAPGWGVLGQTTFNGAFLQYSELDLTTTNAPQGVPEPTTMLLLGSGLLGLAGLRRKFKK